jgi:predicted NAD/FAD-binding protein
MSVPLPGHHRSWFCGAYWYNGFHEDGVRSALDVVNEIAAGAPHADGRQQRQFIKIQPGHKNAVAEFMRFRLKAAVCRRRVP